MYVYICIYNDLEEKYGGQIYLVVDTAVPALTKVTSFPLIPMTAADDLTIAAMSDIDKVADASPLRV